MLRFLSYNHPFTLVAMLMLVFALRFPSFHQAYFCTDESFYLVSAERMVEGGAQYVETWDNKPPVIGWFYALFAGTFGGHALIAIRIFTCLYLFLCAVLINQLVLRNRLLEKYPLLPGFIFILLSSVPWYAQELNAEMLMVLPLILVVFQIHNVSEGSNRNHQSLLMAGFLLGFCVMIKYQAIFLFLAFVVAHMIVNPPRFSEYFSMLGGFLLSLLMVFLGIYFSGALPAWWDIGIVYNLDYISIGRNPGEETSIFFSLQQYGKLWGVFILMGVAGLAWYRLNYFTMAIRLRQLEALFFLWAIGAFFTILAGFSRLYLHYFIALVPPLSFYIAGFLEQKIRGWIKVILLAGAMAGPIYTFGVFLSAAYPKTFSFADKYFEPMIWVKTFRKQLNEPHPLLAKLDRTKVKNGILVMDDNPELYLQLDMKCATKYTNFSIAYYKIKSFPHNKDRELFSKEETLAQVFAAFNKNLPEYIIDPHNLFSTLKEDIPLLFERYKEDSIPGYRFWRYE